MRTYRCPVCNKPLTQRQYERALGILEAQQKHLREREQELRQQLREAKSKERSAKQAGIQVERARTKRLLQGKTAEVQRLKERINQLKRGTTPQTEGIEFEDKLVTRLRREFPEDKIEHRGKGGDVLHTVMHDRKPAGMIIYECKRTKRIQDDHIRQAQAAKRSRDADFAVLVTTGTKKGFSGLTQVGAVLIVSPPGTIALAGLLRAHLIEMLRAKVTRERRAVIAHQLMKFVTSPQFRNPIEGVIQTASELQEMVKKEAAGHVRVWRTRWNHYQCIRWDGTQVQENVRLVLGGKQPKPIKPPKAQRLELPAAGE